MQKAVRISTPSLKAALTSVMALCGALAAGISAHAQDYDLIIKDANVLDVRAGTLKAHTSIAIKEGRIVAISADEAPIQGTAKQSIDASGRYIMPGIWDMHIHLEGKDLVADNELLLPVYLAYGITTVRDAASDLGEQVLAWRDEINQGRRVGPTIYTAGRKLEGIGSVWKDDIEIGTEQALNDGLDYLTRKKVDFVKITENALAGPLFLKSVKTAHDRGFRVSSHVPQDLTIWELRAAGLSSVEHASYMLRLGSDHEAIVAEVKEGTLTKAEANKLYSQNFSQERANAAYKKLAETGLALTPTLIGGRQLAYLAETDHSEDAFLTYLSGRFTSKYQWRIDRMKNDTAADKVARKETYARIKAQLPYLQAAGVTLLAGSDSAALNTYAYPALGLHEELEIFEEAGLKPADILRMATVNGADFMGDDERGELAIGKRADILLLNSNPLAAIKATQDIQAVIKDGTYYDRAQLDTILRHAAAKRAELDKSRAK